jgi:hydroxymethylglutaryl-CoA reductase (NADPH)
MGAGLKNRGKTAADVVDRRMAVEQATGAELRHIAAVSFDPMLAEKNIENMIGAVQVPLGFVGPLRIAGDHAQGEFLVPLATTEGALLASVNRGCSVITAAGGAASLVIKDEMTRAPVFRVKGARHAVQVSEWVAENLPRLREVVGTTTQHGKLLSAKPFAVGRSFYLRFAFTTGDAMGMNMALNMERNGFT